MAECICGRGECRACAPDGAVEVGIRDFEIEQLDERAGLEGIACE